MDFLTIGLLLSLILYGFYYYLKKNSTYFEELGIPYFKGYPLLGINGPAFLRRQHFTQAIEEAYNVNPDAKYVGIFDFIRPVIMLRDPELIKTVTIKNFDNFPNHATSIDEHLDPLMGGALFNMKGERWREGRKLLSPVFTSSKMKSMFQLMARCGKNFADYLTKRTAEENRMVTVKDLFTRYTNDVIASCVFGIEVDSLHDPKNEFYLLGRKATNFEGTMALKFFLSRSFPQILKWFKIKIISDQIGNFFKDLVTATITSRDEKGTSRPDMIQTMMDARTKEMKYMKLDITEITANGFAFFFGGFDTTATQMCLICHELAINPDIQKRLQEEIDEVCRNFGGDPSYEAINEMPYLDAVYNESMRLHTQAPILDRLCLKEFELPPALPGLKPYTVKPGTSLWIPPAAINRDSKYYENPLKFDPDRYYQKKVSINDVYNMSFGIGPRSCIGNRFAILETKILVFFLLAKFNLKPNQKTVAPLRYDRTKFVLTPTGGYWLTFEIRK